MIDRRLIGTLDNGHCNWHCRVSSVPKSIWCPTFLLYMTMNSCGLGLDTCCREYDLKHGQEGGEHGQKRMPLEWCETVGVDVMKYTIQHLMAEWVVLVEA